jgi:Ca-activated chloride channel family protein
MTTGIIDRPLMGIFARLLTGALVSALAFGGAVFLAVPVLAAESDAGPQPADDLGALRPARPEDVRRGSLLLRTATGQTLVDAPLLDTDVAMQISGMFARVAVTQRFRNPGRTWAEGVYVFPLPERAAVDRLRMRVGERIIEGEIQERAQARRTYEKAKREGRKASLLSQERPNIFTNSVANIGPGEEVEVAIEYQQTLVYDQGRFSLRFPLVVAPRYIPGVPAGGEEVTGFAGTGWARDTDQVPDASRITPLVLDQGERPGNPVRIRIDLDVGFPLGGLDSPYHAIEHSLGPDGAHHIRLREDRPAPADRDFELVWVPDPGREPRAALFTETWDQVPYSLVMVMPPVRSGAAPRPPRELIFVVDTSGSMSGASIRQARAALRLALERLSPADRFNIIQFNSTTRWLFDDAVPADPGHLSRALNYVDGLSANGGTEMRPALERALTEGPEESSRLRQIVFLTDGSVGNEEALFRLIAQRLGRSRLFTVGIGSAPNSHFMTRAASFGRGTFTYIGKVEEVQEKMAGLFLKLESPVLTDITAHWPAGAEPEVWPERVPDLYLGEPVVLAARGLAPGTRVTIDGRHGGQPWRQTLDLAGGSPNPGVHAIWARRKIAALMDLRTRGAPEDEVRAAVLETALEHRLVSRYTSLVAVDKTPSRPMDADLETKPVPINLPAGWSQQKVFGTLPQTATSAPLQLLLGLLALAAGMLLHRFSTPRNWA